MNYLTCSDMRELFPNDPIPGCCGPCHDDWDEGFGEGLCAGDLPDGRYYEVCCRVWWWLNDKNWEAA